MVATDFYLLMLQKYISSKKKNLKKKISFVFGKYVSGEFSANNMKETGFVYVCVQFLAVSIYCYLIK